jgi:hypothetical protein
MDVSAYGCMAVVPEGFEVGEKLRLINLMGEASSWLAGISTDNFVDYSYFSLAIIWAGNVKLASSRGFSTDNTHIWDSVCRIATAKI